MIVLIIIIVIAIIAAIAYFLLRRRMRGKAAQKELDMALTEPTSRYVKTGGKIVWQHSSSHVLYSWHYITVLLCDVNRAW